MCEGALNGEGDGLEESGGGDAGAEMVEFEGCGGSGDFVFCDGGGGVGWGCEGRRGDEGDEGGWGGGVLVREECGRSEDVACSPSLGCCLMV